MSAEEERFKKPNEVSGWSPAGKVGDAMVERGYRESVAEGTLKGDTAALRALELERRGGPCHYCDAPFREVRVGNVFADFTYYEPACRCYKRCGNCGRWLVEERFKNLSRCLTCFGEPQKRQEEPRRGGRRKVRDFKAAAAGEPPDGNQD